MADAHFRDGLAVRPHKCVVRLVMFPDTCRLRREYQIGGGIPVLLSTEKPRCQLVSMVDLDGANPLDYQVGGRDDKPAGWVKGWMVDRWGHCGRLPRVGSVSTMWRQPTGHQVGDWMGLWPGGWVGGWLGRRRVGWVQGWLGGS